MEAIYKFYWDCGRMGEVTGVFVADQEVVQEAIGQRIYFGEILGKHSEIYGDLNEKDITEVTHDAKMVELFKLHDLSSGYNPLDYLPEEYEEEQWEEEEEEPIEELLDE